MPVRSPIVSISDDDDSDDIIFGFEPSQFSNSFFLDRFGMYGIPMEIWYTIYLNGRVRSSVDLLRHVTYTYILNEKKKGRDRGDEMLSYPHSSGE
jgi:hypothetical protein